MAGRAHIMKMSSALDDYFCIRLSGPPHSLFVMWLPVGTVSPEFQSRRLDDFYDVPIECLSLHARRIRQRYAKTGFHEDAVEEYLAWGTQVGVSMDGTERGHGLLRSCLQTSGRVRDVEVNLDRAYCGAMATAHKNKGGSVVGDRLDIHTVNRFQSAPPIAPVDTDALFEPSPSVAPAATMPPQPIVHTDEPAEPKDPGKKNVRGQLWNMKLKVFKELRAPHGV